MARDEIKYILDSFPPIFGLRAFPGEIFRMSRQYSKIIDGKVMLYTERKREAWWCLHTRGSEAEMRRQVLPIQEVKKLLRDAIAKIDEELNYLQQTG